MDNRKNREIDTRDVKETKQWAPPSLLPEIKQQPGWAYRWIRVSLANEADNLKTLLPRIPNTINGSRVGVLVVNDGSDDETIKTVKDHGYMVASNLINRGQGAASRNAPRWITTSTSRTSG